MLRAALRFSVCCAALAVFGFAVYEVAEQPTNQIFGRTITGGPSNKRVVALTFDDGPNSPYTERILNVLEQEHVRATFFVVGRAVQSYPWVVRREVRDGDAIGNHTWSHGHLIVMSLDQVRGSLKRTDAAIYKAAGIHTKIMRPPFGSRDWIVMQAAKDLGYSVVMWSVPLARDWEYPPASVIAQRILPYVTDGSIIVLHDGNRGELCSRDRLNPRVCDRRSDIEATRLIVQTLKLKGYRFVTVPQLIALGRAPNRTSAPESE